MFIQKNPYDTSDIKFNNVNELIKERNFNQHNPFTINYSTYYGIEHAIKEFAGFSEDYEIKAHFEHGVSFTSALEAGFRVHECLPTITSSEFRKNIILSEKNNNGAYSIGPYIAYARPLLTSDELSSEKEKLGKNLLVFPSHSTTKFKTVFDADFFTEKILEYGENFDTVTICLYWSDVKRGFAKLYSNLGFNVVTAGYMTDPHFLNRLRSIIELSDETMSNSLGSHTGYCLYLNKPNYFIPMEEKLVRETNSNKLKLRDKVSFYLEDQFNINTDHDDLKYMGELLNEPTKKNKKEILKIFDKYYGFSQVKSKEEIINIINEMESNFSKIKFYLSLPKLMKYYASTYYKGYKNY